MSNEPYFSCRGVGRISIILGVTAFLLVSTLIAAEQTQRPVIEKYRVFNLKNISATQGKEYLNKAKAGTVSILPGKNMLLVTAVPIELIKARVIIGVVDTAGAYSIEKIFSVKSYCMHCTF